MSSPRRQQEGDRLEPTLANEIVVDLTSGDEAKDEGNGGGVNARSYQLEMLEESWRGNVIVTMDTGSGKTHVAVMRMLLELERIPSHQLIWFLAPFVSLSEQQFKYFQTQITSVQVKLLTGADNVERWKEKTLWDAALHNVKIVVSTHQILLDALTHGCVRMESLALIVFDEAHHCVGNHPGAKIMQSFYHRKKSQGLRVPHVLGLTASPVMRSGKNFLDKIEATLDARCRTPKKSRADLMLHVTLPVLSEIRYQDFPTEGFSGFSQTISSLGKVYAGLKISDDPAVIRLRKDPSPRNIEKLGRVILSQKTWCFSQMKSFHTTAIKIYQDLGEWAANYYISEVIARLNKVCDTTQDSQGAIGNVSAAEKRYLCKALQQVVLAQSLKIPLANNAMSDKVSKLIGILLQEPASFRGIIFVQERAAVSVLAHLLSIHPETCDRFKIGYMVGTSTHSSRDLKVVEFAAMDSKNALSEFRSGKLNLIVATSVLEEGIDVPACNVVVCFQKPANLKSFIQRRGRARQKESKLILLLDYDDDSQTEWHQLEEAMRKEYEDDMRSVQKFMILEDTEEQGRCFRVEKTDALLDLDNAVAHLYHFCATIPGNAYVDSRPEFICWEEANQIRAKVILPLSVNEAVRFAQSQKPWTSEKKAIKDAAFEAYLALYRAGLVNDNLLPLLRHVDMSERVETRASLMRVNEQLNPWISISEAWKTSESTSLMPHGMSVIKVGELEMEVCLPVAIPIIPPFRVYCDQETEITVSTSTIPRPDLRTIRKQSEETRLLLSAAFGHRFHVDKRKEFVMLFSTVPKTLSDQTITRVEGDKYNYPQDPLSCGLIQDSNKVMHVYKTILTTKPSPENAQHQYQDYEETPDELCLSLKLLTKRSDFLHKLPAGNTVSTKTQHSIVLSAAKCFVEEMPFRYVQFALFIPSIMHKFEISLIAERLSNTILKPVQISDLSLVITAISASSAMEDTNYQRLEFLGDSILKLCTSIQLMAEYPLWHEGYLSSKKDRLVANSRLSRAAVEKRLDKFIITKPFTGYKWRPLYVDDLFQTSTDGKRNMSSKVLADVVEALIGAAMVDGGFGKALACLQVFLPEMTWQPLLDRQFFLFSLAPVHPLPDTLKPLQTLIGYNFTKPSLLMEAVTHSSFITSGTQSLERLEFLGDSILDNIIVEVMFAHKPQLDHFQMHILRTAMVNADFLAWCCMELCIELETTNITNNAAKPCTVSTKAEKSLSYFLRHASPTLAQTLTMTNKRHAVLRPTISHAIEQGTHYPWSLLARLQAPKFYSDMIESLIGAIWIDSGSLKTCTEFVERLGILKYLRRILDSVGEGLGEGLEEGAFGLRSGVGMGLGIHIWHPKEELGVLAGNRVVNYTLFSVSGGGEGEDVEEGGLGLGGRYGCKVKVGDEEIVDFRNGVDKIEAKTSAAQLAVEILTRRREEEVDVDVDTT